MVSGWPTASSSNHLSFPSLHSQPLSDNNSMFHSSKVEPEKIKPPQDFIIILGFQMVRAHPEEVCSIPATWCHCQLISESCLLWQHCQTSAWYWAGSGVSVQTKPHRYKRCRRMWETIHTSADMQSHEDAHHSVGHEECQSWHASPGETMFFCQVKTDESHQMWVCQVLPMFHVVWDSRAWALHWSNFHISCILLLICCP